MIFFSYVQSNDYVVREPHKLFLRGYFFFFYLIHFPISIFPVNGLISVRYSQQQQQLPVRCTRLYPPLIIMCNRRVYRAFSFVSRPAPLLFRVMPRPLFFVYRCRAPRTYIPHNIRTHMYIYIHADIHTYKI